MVVNAFHPATWEAEIWQTVIQVQPRQKVNDTSSQQQQKLGVVVCTCHPSYKEGINQKTAV
jgi:hypothetical protein